MNIEIIDDIINVIVNLLGTKKAAKFIHVDW